ncbi:MAG TPA: hypothetical protein VMU60_10700 [Syntrophobacteria bacterium]|nr:hypothetical protein [Syntrophobacteria bacterium]
MYLTSFIHRDALFDIAERWLCGRLEPDDGLRITEILICDDFVLSETLKRFARLLLDITYGSFFHEEHISLKGELRDAICRSVRDRNRRVEELVDLYRRNPEFFYREAPINGVVYVDEDHCLMALSRLKRPRRIAEKANRYVANWIFHVVRKHAQEMAARRAREFAVPLESLITPREVMEREFVTAEKAIGEQFKDGTIRVDRQAVTIHDVGGVKVVADAGRLARLEKALAANPQVSVVEKTIFSGNYQATSMIVDVPWDPEHSCRRYMESRGWERYLDRGVPEAELRKGLEPFLKQAQPNLKLELILSTFPDMVESELGNSLHEERIIVQRDNKIYKGYIPMNVEFLIEYLFAVGLSPQVSIDRLPIKLWGRYLPDTIIEQIRALYRIPGYGQPV